MQMYSEIEDFLIKSIDSALKAKQLVDQEFKSIVIELSITTTSLWKPSLNNIANLFKQRNRDVINNAVNLGIQRISIVDKSKIADLYLMN